VNRPLFVYFWSAFSPLLRAGWGVEVMGWVRVGILAVLLAVGGGEEDGGGSNDLQQSPGTALSREAARLYEEGVELCRRGGNAEACRAKMASSLHFDRNQVHPLGREIQTWASVCFPCARRRLSPPPHGPSPQAYAFLTFGHASRTLQNFADAAQVTSNARNTRPRHSMLPAGGRAAPSIPASRA